MKKAIPYIAAGLLAGAALMYLLGPARFPNEQRPAEPTSFRQVTAQLDAGGDLYVYFSTERLIRAIEGLIGKFAKTMPAADGQGEAAIASFVVRLLGRIGLNEISGVGLSNVSLSPELQRTKLVMHHYPERRTGLIWQLGNAAPRALDELDLLPADTALAVFSEFRLDNFWAWLKKELETSGISGARNFAAQVEPLLASQGVPLPKLLSSLSGSVGYVLTLDKERRISIPSGESALAIPEPGLAIVIGTRDAGLFDLLKAKLPMARFTEQGERRTLQFPPIPAPIPLQPTVTAVKGYLIVSSTPRLADALLQARAKADGLRHGDEFGELARHTPATGNGFSYLSPRLWRIYADVIQKIAAGSGGAEGDKFKEILFSVFPRELKVYSVTENRADGVVWTVCHNVNPELIVLMPLASVAGIASAVAIPNLLQAQDKAKQRNTMADLKSAGMAIEAYMTDNGQAPAVTDYAGLKPLLEPFYIKTLPLKDAWGNDLLYKRSGTDTYMIASPGKDGAFQGWQQGGFHPAGQYDQDIIFANGQFSYGPETR